MTRHYHEVEELVRGFVEAYEQLPFGNEFRWDFVQNFADRIRRDLIEQFHTIPCPKCNHPLINHSFNKQCNFNWKTGDQPMSGCMCGR